MIIFPYFMKGILSGKKMKLHLFDSYTYISFVNSIFIRAFTGDQFVKTEIKLYCMVNASTYLQSFHTIFYLLPSSAMA